MGPGHEVTAEELGLVRRLARLPYQQYWCLHLLHVDGLTYPRIAAVMDVTEATVETYFERANRRLVAYLEWYTQEEQRVEAALRQMEDRRARELERLERGFQDVADFREFILRLVEGPRASNPRGKQYDELGREVASRPKLVVVGERGEFE